MNLFLTVFDILMFFVYGTYVNAYYRHTYGEISLDDTENQAAGNESPFTIDFGLSSMLAYVPAKSCHIQFTNSYGVFSPPMFQGNIDINLWCNWTILAGPGKHIVIYIRGFRANLNCDENHDEIIFEGVASSIENYVVYACWNKYTHVFATQALAVHVVFLWRSFSRNNSTKYFDGKYYVFDDPTTRKNTEQQNCVLGPAKPTDPSITSKLTFDTLPTKEVIITEQFSSLHPKDDHRVEEKGSVVEGIMSLLRPSSKDNILQVTLNVTEQELLDPLRYTRQSITEGIQKVAYLESGKYVENSLTETYTKDEFLSPVSTVTFPYPRVHPKVNSTALVHTRELPEDHNYEEQHIQNESHLTPFSLQAKDEEKINYATLSNTTTEPVKTSLAPLLSTDQDIPELLRRLSFPLYGRDEAQEDSMEILIPGVLTSTSKGSDEGIPLWFLETPDWDSNSMSETVKSEDQRSYVNFKKAFTHDHSLQSKDLAEIPSPPTGVLSFNPQSPPRKEEPLPSVQIDNMVEGMLIKTTELHDNIEIGSHPTTHVWDLLQTLEIQPTSVMSSSDQIPTFDNMNLSALSPEVFEQDSTSEVAFGEKPQGTNKAISYPQIVPKRVPDSQLTTPTLPKNVTESKKSMQYLLRTTSLSEPWLMASTTAERLENTKHARLVTKDSYVTTSSDTHNKKHVFLGGLVDIHKNKHIETDIHVATGDSHARAVDSSITSKAISGDKEGSTYPYQSLYIDYSLLEEQPPESDLFDTFGTITSIGNKTELGFPHVPGESLFAIIVEIEQNGVMSNEAEAKLIELTRQKIQQMIVYFPNAASYTMLKKKIWKSEKLLLLTFWLHLKNGGRGRDMANFIQTQLNALTNTSLGTLNATVVSASVEDVNECQTGVQQCATQAYCLNELGTYSCQCMNGYDDHSPATPGTVCISSQPSGLHILFDHLEILIGSVMSVLAIMLVIVIVLCVLLKKKHVKGNFSLQESTKVPSNVRTGASVVHQSDSSLNLSKPTGCLPPRHFAGHLPAQDAPSTLELTKITIEHTAC